VPGGKISGMFISAYAKTFQRADVFEFQRIERQVTFNIKAEVSIFLARGHSQASPFAMPASADLFKIFFIAFARFWLI